MKEYFRTKAIALFESIIERVLINNIKEIQESNCNYTSYKLIDESGNHLADCDMYLKPSVGDIILSDGLKYPALVCDVEVIKIKISTTGLTGFIECRKK